MLMAAVAKALTTLCMKCAGRKHRANAATQAKVQTGNTGL